MTLSLSKLMAVADKATDGPWSVEAGDGELDFKPRFATDAAVMVCAMDDCDVHPLADCSQNYSCRDAEQAGANAAHIATFDPPTVKRLLAIAKAADAVVKADNILDTFARVVAIRASLEGVEP